MFATGGGCSLDEGDVHKHHLESWEVAQRYPRAMCHAEQREWGWGWQGGMSDLYSALQGQSGSALAGRGLPAAGPAPPRPTVAALALTVVFALGGLHVAAPAQLLPWTAQIVGSAVAVLPGTVLSPTAQIWHNLGW